MKLVNFPRQTFNQILHTWVMGHHNHHRPIKIFRKQFYFKKIASDHSSGAQNC